MFQFNCVLCIDSNDRNAVACKCSQPVPLLQLTILTWADENSFVEVPMSLSTVPWFFFNTVLMKREPGKLCHVLNFLYSSSWWCHEFHRPKSSTRQDHSACSRNGVLFTLKIKHWWMCFIFILKVFTSGTFFI